MLHPPQESQNTSNVIFDLCQQNQLPRQGIHTNGRNACRTLLFNSVISTHGARFMTMEIANFYLMNPLKRPEYVKIKLRDIPEEIIGEYKLQDLATADVNVYIKAS